MVAAWLMATSDVTDQRLPNQRTPNVPVSMETLFDLGVLHWKLDPATMFEVVGDNTKCKVDQIMDEMGYKNRDEVRCSPDHLPEYDAKLKTFFTEHMHEDEEIRLIKDGSGYFDVRDRDDQWVRIQVEAGDLIVLPPGIYHRFTMDDKNWTHAVRLFKDAPKWTPVNRPCEENNYRADYAKKYLAEKPVAKATVVGESDDADNFYVHDPANFDAVTRSIISNRLRATHGDLLVQYFSGTHNPVTGKSWCPDCVTTDPKIRDAVLKARAENPERRVILMQVGLLRSSYLGNSEHLLVKHPFVGLKCIPTLMVLAAKAAKDEEDESGVDVIYRAEDDKISEEWIERARALLAKQ